MDIWWEQRFSNFNKAFQKLQEAVLRIKNENYTEGMLDQSKFENGDDILKEGLIQRFEYTHELAWNVMKDFLEDRGTSGLFGSRDATREAFEVVLISDGKIWMDMINSRNKTSHTYNEKIADEIFEKILEEYYPAFLNFQQRFSKMKSTQ
jgi:nucleotidyltransferase substrate binding protein (TIGR01987 family)